MTEPVCVVLRLELDVTNDPIAGRLLDEHGREQSFTGWVGLTQALTGVLDAVRHTEPPSPARPTRRAR